MGFGEPPGKQRWTLNKVLKGAGAAADPTEVEVPEKTSQDLTYYVDATNGNDSNDGSEAFPFQTIAHAVSQVPKVLCHGVWIYLVADTWNEPIDVDGFICLGNSALFIEGTTTNPANHKVTYIEISRMYGYVGVKNIQCTATGRHSVLFTYCDGYIYADNILVTAPDASYCAVRFSDAVGWVMNCTLSNKLVGILADYRSHIFSYLNSGSGNTYGVRATHGGIITLESDAGQPGGTTAISAATGGIAVRDSGIVLGD